MTVFSLSVTVSFIEKYTSGADNSLIESDGGQGCPHAAICISRMVPQWKLQMVISLVSES